MNITSSTTPKLAVEPTGLEAFHAINFGCSQPGGPTSDFTGN